MKRPGNISPFSKPASTSFLPKLPIEAWFKTLPFFIWETTKEGDDWLLQFSDPPPLPKDADGFTQFHTEPFGMECRGLEYVDSLLKIRTPSELVAFLNVYGCPIDGIVQDPVDGDWHRTTVPFHWSEFLKFQANLKDAMRLPITKLRRFPEFEWAFDLTRFGVHLEQRDGVYYGTLTTNPSVEGCYRVIAIERLLGDVQYGFCRRCGNPFQKKSRHERKYCNTATCGHASAQEKYRRRLKKSQKPRNSS